MNIAINIDSILKDKTVLSFINKLSKDNNIYITINEEKYNKKLKNEIIAILEEFNINVRDIILYNKDNFEKIIEVRNIGLIIDDENNLKENKNIPIVAIDEQVDNLICVKNVTELEKYFEEYKSNLIKKIEVQQNRTEMPSQDKIWMKKYNLAQMMVNLPKMSVYDYIYYNNYSNLDSLALRYFGRQITFKEFFDKIDDFAKSLKKSGVKEGDIVTICMPNTPEGVIAFFAVNKIGAIASMIHPLLKGNDILDNLKQTKSKYMVMADMCYNEVNKIIDETEVAKVVVVSPSASMPVIGGLPFGIKFLYKAQNLSEKLSNELNEKKWKLIKTFAPKDNIGLEKIINNELEKYQIDTIKYNSLYVKWNDEIKFGKDYNGNIDSKYSYGSPAVLLRTGGTTGKSKLVELTNENIISNTSQLRDTIPFYEKNDELLAISPIFHGFGLVDSVITALAVNMSVDLHPKYNKSIFVKSVIKNKPTLILGVPTLFKAMRTDKKFNGKDLSHLKVMICGGDTLPVEERLKQNKWKLQHNSTSPVFVGMGLTQATAAISFTGMESSNEQSVGFPLPLNNVKIIDPDTMEELTYLKPGELCVSGPTVMKGYFKNIEETKDALFKDKNGNTWLRTGDICYIDLNGEVCFLDRQDNMIIVSGVNVYSNEIEPVLMEIPEIESCAVIGTKHPYKMNAPKAYIVLKKGFVLTEELKNKILNYCNHKLDAYHKIYEIEQIDKIPLTPLNKIHYSELRKLSEEKNEQKIIK